MVPPLSDDRFTDGQPIKDETNSDIALSQAARERLRRLARLIATGEAALPQSLEPADSKFLMAEVARLRRVRLVRFFGRAIAQDIWRSRGVK